MKSLKSAKGFTLVELLAVIALLSILTVAVIFSVRSLLQKSHKSYYESEEKMIILAAKTYFSDYKSKLPKEIGNIEKVTLETLINEKYLDPVYDHNKQACDYKNSFAYAQKATEKTYYYYVFLLCPSNKTEKDTTAPVISFTPNQSISNQNLTVKMKITDNEAVASYRYIIKKDGVEITDSGVLSYDGEVDIPLTEDGIYQIIGYAYDTSGNMGTKTSGEFEIKKTGPVCDSSLFTIDKTAGVWMKGTVTIKVTPPTETYRWTWTSKKNSDAYSNEQSFLGAISKEFSFTGDGKYQGKVTLYDKVGNSCSIETGSFWLQNSNPTISNFTITSTNNRYNDINTKLTISASNVAGLPMQMYISNTGYETGGSWEAYATSKNWSVGGSLDGGTRTVYLVIKDSLGNTSRVQKTYTVYGECVNTTSSTTTGSCSKVCGSGTQTVTTTYKDNITGKVCRTNVTNPACNTFDCCSSVNTTYGAWSACNVSCGNGQQTRTVTYTSKYNGQSCGSTTESKACSAGSCTTVTIRNANYTVCPSDMNWQDCSVDGRYDSFYISNASVSGTTVSFSWRVHANNYTVSSSGRCPGRMVCISDTSNNCIYNIHQFNVSDGWISPGGNITGNVSVNVGSWTKTDYKVIVKEYNCTLSNTYSYANRFVDNNTTILFNIS